VRLVVVYGLKTGDYAWAESFYPLKRILQACARQRVHVSFVLPCDFDCLASGGLAEELQAENYAHQDVGSAASGPLCLIRGSVEPGMVRSLEEAGYRCVNGSKAVALALDKLECTRFLDEIGVPAPRTVAPVVGTGGCIGEPPFGYPFVAKPRFGSRGRGVSLVEDTEGLADLAPRIRSEAYVFQEFVKESAGRDLRFFFAGGGIVACVERCGREGSFVSNASGGGSVRIPENCEALVERLSPEVLRIAREAGLWYGSVDFLFGSGGFPVCEINACPGFEALEEATGLDVAGVLVERLVQDFAGA